MSPLTRPRFARAPSPRFAGRGLRDRGTHIEYVKRVRLFDVKQPSRLATHEYVTARQNDISPCLHASGQGSPSFHSHLPRVEGDGAPTRRSARIAPGGCPAAAGPGCTAVHPRLAARQRASSAYASSTVGPAGAICPWWVSPSVARGSVCVIADPQVPSRSAPYKRLRKAPSNLDRDGLHVG
jgi:hypothetical protein